jgi:hypothetical protein
VLDDVVTVEGDLGLWQMLGDAADERRAHIGAHAGHLLRRAAVSGKVGGEPLDGGRVTALGDEHRATLVEVL